MNTSDTEVVNGIQSLNFTDNQIDWTGLGYTLSAIDWDMLFQDKTPAEIYELILEKLCQIRPLFIPKKKPGFKCSIPRDRKILMRKRLNLRKKSANFKGLNYHRITQQLVKIEEQLKSSHLQEIQNNEAKAISRMKSDPKYFYKYAKSKSITKSVIGPFIVEGELIQKSSEKSNVLLKQYSSVYSSTGYTDEIINRIIETPGARCIDDIDLQISDIDEAIDSLKGNSAPGEDGIPVLLLKSCKTSLNYPILKLWRASIECGKIPKKLKFGTVIPIFKAGNKCDPKNYRPITLTSHIIKLFEKVLVKKLVKFLDEANLFNKHQHGFRRGRSCLSQLLEHYQLILSGMENGDAVAVVYLDFCKAFDKVDHKIVLDKLHAIGITGSLLRWIGNFLIGRHHIVIVDKSKSEVGEVKSGVPQGSVLGPLLFLILISDIDCQLVRSHASSFADDTRVVMNVGSEADVAVLQEELRKVYEWAENNAMVFNSSKFDHLEYLPHSHVDFQVELKIGDGSIIRKPEIVKDLGVLMGKDASFSNHITEVVAKGRKQVGWVLRTFKCRDHQSMLTLFKSTVLPLVEYCSQLWSPVRMGEIRQLEGVQRNFTARIEGLSEVSYEDRLKRLKLYSLERRRERYIVLYVYKIIIGQCPNLEDDRFKIKVGGSYDERRGISCLRPPLRTTATARTKTVVDQSFCVRGPKLFNCMPIELRNRSVSYLCFKTKLDTFLGRVRDNPCLPGQSQQVSSNTAGF